jgi:hypothetical protein
MARIDWWYPNIPKKQADALDIIVKDEGLKYGIIDKGELVRFIVGDFIARYEEEHGMIKATKKVSLEDAGTKKGKAVR